MLFLVFVILSTGCTNDPSAQYFVDRPAATPPPVIDSSAGATVAAHAQMTLHGPVSKPNPALTPGAVATKSTATVCSSSRKVVAAFSPRNPAVSLADQQTVFANYKIAAPLQGHYGLDYLVPLQLGGANVTANIWPVMIVGSRRGAGFREKQVLNIRLHVLVCHGEMPLAQAQESVASDWVKLWLIYGA